MKQRAQSGRWTWETVAGFYGVKRRFYFETEAMGRKLGKAPPWENPVKLGDWFDTAQGQGLRKKAPPPSLVQKVMAARMGEPMTMPVIKAKPEAERAETAGKPEIKAKQEVKRKPVPKTAAKLPKSPKPEVEGAEEPEEQELPFDDIESGESDAAANLAYLRGEAFRLQKLRRKLLRARKFDMAAAESMRLKDIMEQQRQYEVSAAKIRQGDHDAQRAMMGKMALFSQELWELLQRAFMRDCPPDDERGRRKVLNKVAESLPGLMESHFGLADGTEAKEAA